MNKDSIYSLRPSKQHRLLAECSFTVWGQNMS